MENVYTRERIDRMADDVAVTRNKVEAIERILAANQGDSHEYRDRLGRLERKVFAIWILAPLVMGGAALVQTLRAWLTEQ